MFNDESTVIIDGKTLLPAQVATLRVAVTDFLLELEDPSYVRALGLVGPLYKQRAREVVRMLVAPRPVPADVRVAIGAATEGARDEVRRLERAIASITRPEEG